MRIVTLLIMLGSLSALSAHQEGEKAQKPAKRYGFDVNQDLYPQKTPQDALKSVVRAIERQKIDYLMAQLADPEFVDKRVEEYKKDLTGKEEGKTIFAFDRVVKEAQDNFREDPDLVKDLVKIARDAKDEDWKVGGNTAVGTLKNLPGRRVYLKKSQERWFLENRQR